MPTLYSGGCVMQAEIKKHADELVTRIKKKVTQGYSISPIVYVANFSASAYVHAKVLEQVMEEFGITISKYTPPKGSTTELQVRGNLEQFIDWDVLEPEVAMFFQELLNATVQEVIESYSPESTSVSVDNLSARELVRRETFARMAALGLHCTWVSENMAKYIAVAGNLRALIPEEDLNQQVADLVIEIREEIEQAVLEQYKPGMESVSIPNFTGGGISNAVAWLARERLEKHMGIKIEDLPPGHGGSRKNILVKFQGNLDQFLPTI